MQAICQRMMQLKEGDLQLQEIANAVSAPMIPPCCAMLGCALRCCDMLCCDMLCGAGPWSECNAAFSGGAPS